MVHMNSGHHSAHDYPADNVVNGVLYKQKRLWKSVQALCIVLYVHFSLGSDHCKDYLNVSHNIGIIDAPVRTTVQYRVR